MDDVRTLAKEEGSLESWSVLFRPGFSSMGGDPDE